MYWEDTTQESDYKVPDDVVDLSFKLRCPTLPADHAYSLSVAIREALPWLEEILTGIYILCGAESGNGWMRQDSDDALIHLSKRARLNLRLAKQHIEQATQLEQQTLNINNHSCAVGESKVRLLSTHGTLFARHLILTSLDEETFLSNAAQMLAELGVKPLKMIGGLNRTIQTPQQTIKTRSLMIDGLTPQESILVQQRGLGTQKELGCGIFLPHKGIAAVRKKPNE